MDAVGRAAAFSAPVGTFHIPCTIAPHLNQALATTQTYEQELWSSLCLGVLSEFILTLPFSFVGVQ